MKPKHNKKTMKKKKHEKVDYSENCENISGSQYNKYLQSKDLSTRIPDYYLKGELKNNLFFERLSSIFNINGPKWTNKMRQQYKFIRDNYSMVSESKEWSTYKEKAKCNIYRTIKKNMGLTIVGILSIPTTASASLGATSYIPQSYVKWIEMQGARVVPIQYDLPPQMMNVILNQIDGVLFIGGAIERNVIEKNHYKYLASMRYITAKIIEQNMNGNHFPIFSICLGFELLPIVAMDSNISRQSDAFLNNNKISDFTHIGGSTMKFTNLTKEEEQLMVTKPLHHEFTTKDKFDFANGNNIYNYHNKSFLMDEKYMKEYEEFLKVVTYTEHKGKKYVSMYQFKSLPFYGVQFHPEKVLYEFIKEGIPKSQDAIRLSQKLCGIFIRECQKNYNLHVFGVSNDANFFIENYDLLSRENAVKILFPDKTKVVNQSAFGASYYFGRTDYTQSDFVHVPNASLEKSIKEDKGKKAANVKKQKIGQKKVKQKKVGAKKTRKMNKK